MCRRGRARASSYTSLTWRRRRTTLLSLATSCQSVALLITRVSFQRRGVALEYLERHYRQTSIGMTTPTTTVHAAFRAHINLFLQRQRPTLCLLLPARLQHRAQPAYAARALTATTNKRTISRAFSRGSVSFLARSCAGAVPRYRVFIARNGARHARGARNNNAYANASVAYQWRSAPIFAYARRAFCMPANAPSRGANAALCLRRVPLPRAAAHRARNARTRSALPYRRHRRASCFFL